MSKNWNISLYITGAYVLSIFAGQSWMKNRPAFVLRKQLAIWNISLAVFSILATVRTLPELLGILARPNGLHHSVCSPCEDVSPDSAFWAWAFVLSKVVELGDTAFIVLRKQPLIFLHWYHHVTVLIYAWYSYGDYIAPARWFVVMNYTVHSFMYSYYALKSLRFHIPRPISMAITCLQLSQMVLGVTVNLYAYSTKNQNVQCDVKYHHLNVGLGTYASYFLLFSNFFYRAYMHGHGRKAKVQ
ncbi:unnamed protein product [Allacma fusca]|uniref:Elongation of very long chain fatty acids protein n=1 Tax=Allacma fusca TaxID=39272 RepID=A0A8J2L9T2_9HEXA|nr:unnamed protein product [Allacma fusca]